MKVALTMLALTLAIAACESRPVSSAAPNPATDEGACLSQGYSVGSTPYTACVQREAARRS
jgi:hypothetical protein